MTKEIVIVVGLPGSGKSHLINTRFSKYALFDDYKAGAVLDRSDFCFSQRYPELIEEIKSAEKNIVISDIDFCNEASYSEAMEILEWWLKRLNSDYKTKSIFFQNEPGKCKGNLTRDNDRDNDSRDFMIDKYTQQYNPKGMLAEGDELLLIHDD